MPFTYITGSGTQQDPYIIENENCLKELLSTNDSESYKNSYFKQTADITVNDITNYSNWENEPPSYTVPFNKGDFYSYDGDNHSIYGLYLAASEYRDGVAALFLYRCRIIKNLNIYKSLIRLNDHLAYCAVFSADCGEVTNCETDTDIIIEESAGYTYLNLMCACSNRNENFTADNCRYFGNIIVREASTEYNEIYMNGLFDVYINGTSEIKKCSNQGKLIIDESANIQQFHGVLSISSSEATVEECFNSMDCISQQPNDNWWGPYLSGIGWVNINGSPEDSYIRNCYNIGNLMSMSPDFRPEIAGITSQDELPVYNCYNYSSLMCNDSDDPDYSYRISPNCTDSYYREDLTDIIYEDDPSIGLTEAEFKEKQYFNNWDFVDTWILEDGDRPMLRNNSELNDETEPAETYELSLQCNYDDYGTVTGAGNYEEGDSVVITATPSSGYAFVRWDDGDTENPRTIIMPASSVTYTANFGFTVNAVSADDTMGSVTGGGNYCPGEQVTLTAIPNAGYRFLKWNDDNIENPRHVLADNTTFTATFAQIVTHTVTLASNDASLGSVTGSGEYEEGTVVEIEAIPEQDITFVEWSDGVDSNPRSIEVVDDISLTAVFGYYVQVFQSEYGNVTGEGAYAAGANATLTATPVEDFYFWGWADGNSDNPRTVTVNTDMSFEPVYRMKKSITIQSSNGEYGGVSFEENGPFESSITARVTPGTEVTVYTSPAQQYQLSSWSDGGSGTPRTITVNDNLTVTAVFSKILRTFYITVEANNQELGTVTGTGYAQENSYITITAVPRAGARFIGWADGDMQTTRSVLVVGDATYTAMFEEIIYFTVEATSNDPVFGHVDGTGVFEEGSQITLTAVPEEGYAFSAWSDGVLSASRIVILDENKSFHAIFMKLYHRMVNTYRYDGKVGRMKANGKIYSSITLYRSLDMAESACVELGQFDTNTGKHFIFVSVKDATRYILKQYSLSLNHNHTSGEWFRADPIDSSDLVSNEFQLEVKSDGVSAALRLKRLTGGAELDFQVVIQNLGIEDESWFEGQESYIDTTDVPSYIESMPAGLNRYDHMHLANRGDYTHAEIDAHLDDPNPHPGHEVTSDKNVPGGYAGLDDAANVPLEHLPVGGGDDQLVLGSDPRLSDDRYPTSHAHSHTSDGNDTLHLSTLAGNLEQDRTHNNVDTDASEDSIHHTLGDGHTQAAPGDHLHDERYAPIAQGVIGGNDHVHDGEDTAKVDHANLLNKGIYTHEQLDAHLEATTPHSGHEDKANKDIPNGYAGLNALGKIKSEEIGFGIGPGSVCEGNDPRLNNARPPSAHAQYHGAEGSDPITISTLAGNLTQARSHDAADTDASAESIHHTLGTGATQAAAGNHNHDSAYAPISMLLADNSDLGPNLRVSNTADTYVLGTVAVTTEVETGETDPVSGNPVTETVTELKTRFHKLSHNDLSDKGTYDHTDIDQFINDATQYEVTARRGQADGYASLDANGRIPLSQMPLSTSNAVPNVADITARDAMTNVEDGAQVRVLDASGDESVDSGWALYTYYADQDAWVKLAEQESLDMITDWSNLQNKPVSSVSDIDAAAGMAHDQNTDQALDYGGSNEVTAAAIKAHLESFTAHEGNEVLSNKGKPDGYAELDSTGRLPTEQLPLDIAAATADSATTAVSATTADHATTADTAISADSASEADSLSEAFDIVLSGDATGSVSIDGSTDVTLNVTIPALAADQFSLMSAEEVEAIIV